jgi:hypothetical protein
MSSTHTIFITVPYSDIRHLAGVQEDKESNAGINILLDSETIDIAEVRNFIGKYGSSFMFSISDAVINSKNILAELYLLLTMADQFTSGKKIIPFFTDNTGDSRPGTLAISNYFQQQGQADIEFAVFQTAGSQLNNKLLVADLNWLKVFGKEEEDKYSGTRQIILPVDKTRTLAEQMAYIGKLAADNPYIKTFFSAIQSGTKNSQLQYEALLWEKRAGLYLSFIELGKKVGESEYYDMRKWYHDEYEVLPLWYKRFGHILKVLKGKRTFRSLFSDKVKKHKE